MEAINRKNPPVTQKITEISIPKAAAGELDNKIPYQIIAGGSQELVCVHIHFNAGSIYSNQKLIASITNTMLTCGTSKHNAQQIADAFDFYGAELQTNCYHDIASVELFCLNKYLDKILPLYCEIISDSIFPENELKTELTKRKHKWLEDRENTKLLAQEEFFRLTLGEHPYARHAELEDYDKITAEALADFYSKHYHAGNCRMIVAGYVTDDVIQAINSTIGQMTANKPVAYKNTPIIEPANNQQSIIIKENAVQSSLRMGFSTITMQNPDFAKLHVLLTVLGGYFGSRLMSNIREDKGYTYGIYSHLMPRKQTSLLRIAGEIKAGFASTVVEEVKKEMQRLKDEPISNDEMNLVRNYMMGDLMQQFDGPFLSFNAIINTMAIDVDISYFTELQKTILNITTDELQATANKYFDLNRIATAIAGKE